MEIPKNTNKKFALCVPYVEKKKGKQLNKSVIKLK